MLFGTLFALLRLSCPDADCRASLGVGKTAMVRELHVFGPELVLGERRKAAAQHRGLGALLMEEAERVAATEMGMDTLRVLSGVGVKDYYRQLGYSPDGPYMAKSLQ